MNKFTPHQKKVLLSNPNVLKLTDNHLFFTPEFKIEAVENYLKGMSPKEVFISYGFDLDYFSDEFFFKTCIKRWKAKYELLGKESFFIESRGSSGGGRPKKENIDDLSIDDLRALVYIQGEIIEEIKKKKALVKK